jgi:hypothetical protein
MVATARVVRAARPEIDRCSQDEGVLRIDALDREPEPASSAGIGRQLVPERHSLPLRHHSVGAWSAGVVEQVVAVPAGTPAAQLHEPRPDNGRRRVDGGAHGRGGGTNGKDVVAGQRRVRLIFRRAPGGKPRPQRGAVDDVDECAAAGDACGGLQSSRHPPALRSHAARARRWGCARPASPSATRCR